MWSYLGQNFLTSSKIIYYIASSIEQIYADTKATTIIEIGPWKWAITKKIYTIPDIFVAIEKDTTLISKVEGIFANVSEDSTNPATQICINEDILTCDMWEVLSSYNTNKSKTVIVWNLPYYITSPILRACFATPKWQEHHSERSTSNGDITHQDSFAAWFFMMQKEVGENIKTDTEKKSFLWWLINYDNVVVYRKTVPAKAFRPAPKVTSCLMHIIPYVTYPTARPRRSAMIFFLEHVSLYTRKTLGKISKILAKKWIEIDCPEHIASKRLETCTWEDLCILCNKL